MLLGKVRESESPLKERSERVWGADNEITLPMYAALTDEQIEFIVENVNKAING